MPEKVKKNVFIVGVGGSGTTALYTLAQEIFQYTFDREVQYTYEPFIWNTQYFDRPYRDAGKYFGKLDSISIEGIYQHLELPLFISDEVDVNVDLSSKFFKRFEHSKKPHVAKFIRANGRLSLLRSLNSEARIILAVRNPLSTVNSSKNKFSFYGDDFYPSDYPRFCRELESSGCLLTKPSEAGWAEKQAEYCFQMTRAALRFATRDPGTMVVQHESLLESPGTSVDRVCRFLSAEKRDDYSKLLSKPIGPVKGRSHLSKDEIEKILPYSNAYDSMLEEFAIRPVKSSPLLVAEFKEQTGEASINEHMQGLTTNRLRNEIRKREAEILNLREKVAQLRRKLG